jgi:enoyl-CoA hydratase
MARVGCSPPPLKLQPKKDFTMTPTTSMAFETITTATQGPDARRVGIVTLNRPQQLNALNDQLMDELASALTFADAYGRDFITRNWEQIRSVRKPVIAAVSGFALGGGCELAMMCDFIIAADNAKFGQPEIKLGIIPGAGGTQRLPRAVGKAKAMDLALTGRMMDAVEAERAGLVSRVVPLDKLMDEALGAALTICSFSQPSVMAAKESINRAVESGLSDGVMFERRLFHAMFATEDQKEGMDAFMNKRKAVFKHR